MINGDRPREEEEREEGEEEGSRIGEMGDELPLRRRHNSF